MNPSSIEIIKEYHNCFTHASKKVSRLCGIPILTLFTEGFTQDVEVSLCIENTFNLVNPLSPSVAVWQQIILSVLFMNEVSLLSKMKVICDTCLMEAQYCTQCAISSYFSTIHTEVNM